MVYAGFDESLVPPSQRWENLTLANDFLFGKIMRDPELCTEMIRRILPAMDIGRIEFTRTQKSEKDSLDTRGVRFDVYAKSDNRKIFDCEVQTSDKKDLPRRTRAYHIVLGLEALEKETLKRSGTYNDMPDTYVIFLCTFDPFNLGRHIYTFSNMCSEESGLELNDGAFTVFLNARGKADDVSGELKAFLDFMMGKTSSDPFVRRLEKLLTFAKQNAEWRQNYMMLLMREWETRSEARNEGLAEGRAEGLAEGRAEGRTEGRAEGRAQGLAEGRAEGRVQGLAEGRAEGRVQGLAEGHAEGRAEGLSIGKEQGRAETLSSVIEFMKSEGMSEEVINSLKNAVLKS